jgi:endonuclease/exonuclease/phosphatase family metal-dependent hydrolase
MVVVVACTDWRIERAEYRRAQTAELARILVRENEGATLPTLLLGDLNAHPDTPEIADLTRVAADSWTAPEAGHTFSSANPYVDPNHHLADQRIDYVFVRSRQRNHLPRPARSWLAGIEPVDGVVPSDHFAVLADVAT